jgi:GTPase SAR1 family protein
MRHEAVKLVFAGDSFVGKTALLGCYYMQTPCDFKEEMWEYHILANDFTRHNMLLNCMIDGECYQHYLVEVNNGDDRDTRFRNTYSYGLNVDVFLICYSIVDHNSFENVKSFWLPEAIEHNPASIKMLIATKEDLRNEEFGLSEMQRILFCHSYLMKEDKISSFIHELPNDLAVKILDIFFQILIRELSWHIVKVAEIGSSFNSSLNRLRRCLWNPNKHCVSKKEGEMLAKECGFDFFF